MKKIRENACKAWGRMATEERLGLLVSFGLILFALGYNKGAASMVKSVEKVIRKR